MIISRNNLYNFFCGNSGISLALVVLWFQRTRFWFRFFLKASTWIVVTSTMHTRHALMVSTKRVSYPRVPLLVLCVQWRHGGSISDVYICFHGETAMQPKYTTNVSFVFSKW